MAQITSSPSARPSRRRFLTQSLAAGSLLVLPRGLRANSTAANSRLRIAQIGVGGRGAAALMGLAHEQFVAFCDVDDVRGREAVMKKEQTRWVLEKFPEARWFKDFRVMFDEMADEIDAVAIVTPDHSHFPAAMAAVAHGKHIFVEKPLCRTISEVRRLRAAAEAAGVVTQMGNQGRAAEGIRLAREWVQGGVIGEVHTVHAWTDRPRQPWFHPAGFDPDAGRGIDPVPATLDWDLWLAANQERPYRPSIAPAFWRSFPEFGCGSLGDMGCHQIDAPFYALDLEAPSRIAAATSEKFATTFPQSTAIHYEFPGNGQRGPVDLHWFDGQLRPPSPVPGFELEPMGGSIFYGTKGIMQVSSHSGRARLLPDEFMRDMRPSLPPKSIRRIKGGHFKEWTDAIRGGPACGSQFSYAAPLTETVLLGMAAVQAGTPLAWDAERMTFPNCPSADAWLGRDYPYRAGWGV